MRKVNFVQGIVGAIYPCILIFGLIFVIQPEICQSSDGVSEMATKKSMNGTSHRGGLKYKGKVTEVESSEMPAKGPWFRGGIRGSNSFRMVRSDNENSSRTKGKWFRGGIQHSNKIDLEDMDVAGNDWKLQQE